MEPEKDQCELQEMELAKLGSVSSRDTQHRFGDRGDCTFFGRTHFAARNDPCDEALNRQQQETFDALPTTVAMGSFPLVERSSSVWLTSNILVVLI